MNRLNKMAERLIDWIQKPLGTVILTLCLLMIAVVSFRAESAKNADIITPSAINAFHLRAVLAEEAALVSQGNARLDSAIAQFKANDPQLKQIQTRLDALAKEKNPLIDEIYKSAGVSKEVYQLKETPEGEIQLAKINKTPEKAPPASK